MANDSLRIKLLQASVDEDDESHFRLLINDKTVKYIIIDAGLFDTDDMCFAPSLIDLLPPFPPGDWKTGRISRNPATGDAHFASVSEEPLPGITKIWHSTTIDHLELGMPRKLRSGVYEATCPRFGATVVVAKFARFAWEIPQLEAETEAYEWIEGHHIGPGFLGHLTEEGRVIGFLIAQITDCHHATPDDFAACDRALSRLHELGIRHGDINKHNFLVRGGEDAVLIDFDVASRLVGVNELEDESRDLMNQLHDTSGRGGFSCLMDVTDLELVFVVGAP
ncbi:alpha-galactosidase A precursor [Astrocystis sublimbata]|nr:alpha-galactosidase A precursor [Astrocystis sublimbata]